ncbi:hypothetical protein [Vibrio crassostreae]|uniref:hypothetical protein n=1 Tax=Vibrio crassostreae TaxID=246167 RepID=UPI001B31562B|nr:hypothetical protein [Vibrio crassostreae]
MYSFTAEDFESKVLSTIDQDNAYAGVELLQESAPELFTHYLSLLRKRGSKAVVANTSLVEVVKDALSMYYDEDGTLRDNKRFYKDQHRHIKPFLSKFTKDELLCIVYDLDLEDAPLSITEFIELFTKGGELDIRFPCCVSDRFVSPDTFTLVLNSLNLKPSKGENLENWIERLHGYPLMFSNSAQEELINHLVEQGICSEYGLLDDLHTVGQKYRKHAFDYHITENKIFAESFMEVAFEALFKLGFRETLASQSDQPFDEEESVERNNFHLLTLFMSDILSPRNSSAKFKTVVEEKFLGDMVEFILEESRGEHEDSLLDGIYQTVLVEAVMKKVGADTYEGEPLKISPRFISMLHHRVNTIEPLKNEDVFCVKWNEDDEEDRGWGDYTKRRDKSELNESNLLSKRLDSHNYYLLSMTVDIEDYDTPEFQKFCNENKAELFEEAGHPVDEFKALKPNAITFFEAHWKK